MDNYWLVVSIPLKNMSSSVGIMKFPIYGKSESSHVPNHQPDSGSTMITIWLFNIAMENDSFIDGLPNNSMVIFHGFVSHNQMVILSGYSIQHPDPKL